MGRKPPMQKRRIIQYMRETGSITAWEAYKEIGCMQLATRLCELETMGWTFNRVKEARLNRWGEKVHFTRYSIKEAGLEI